MRTSYVHGPLLGQCSAAVRRLLTFYNCMGREGGRGGAKKGDCFFPHRREEVCLAFFLQGDPSGYIVGLGRLIGPEINPYVW